MQSGSFDHYIQIYTYTTTQDDNTGEEVKSWELLSNVWARVRPSDSGREGINAERRENKQRVWFDIRYLAALTVGDKIYFEENYYNIISKNEIERKMYYRVETELTDEIYPTNATTEGFLIFGTDVICLINDTDLLLID